MDNSLRFYLMGQESLLIHCAELALEAGHTICGVISKSEQLRGWAADKGLAVVEPGKGLADRLTEPFDYFLSITNLSVVPDEVIAKAKHGGINFHDGPLPRYAGLYATAWALMGGEESHGITWHEMTANVDEGRIYHQTLFDLRGDETSFALNTRCYEVAIESFGELIAGLGSGELEPKAQPEHEPHYFGRDKRPRAAGLLDWNKPATELASLVRALNFGPVDNPLALAKLVSGDRVVMVGGAEAREAAGDSAPGTIIAIGDELVVATGEGDIALLDFRCENGIPIDDLAARDGLEAGKVLAALDEGFASRVTEVHERVGRFEPQWSRRMDRLTPPEIPYTSNKAGEGRHETATLSLEGLDGAGTLAAVTAFLGRLCDVTTFHVGYRDAEIAALTADTGSLFSDHVPLRLALDTEAGFDSWRSALAAEIGRVHKRGTFANDMLLRSPDLLTKAGALRADLTRIVIERVSGDHTPPASAELAIAIADDGTMTWHHDPGVLSAESIARMHGQLSAMAASLLADETVALGKQSLLSKDEHQQILEAFNATSTDYDKTATIVSLFEAQTLATPDAPAVAHLADELTFAELNQRANQLAHHLRSMGVGTDALVGVCVERSANMLVAALGVMKAGGAYVPMDPDYPRDRIALMLEDSGAKVVVTQRRLLSHLPEGGAKRVCIDDDWGAISQQPDANLDDAPKPDNLAYTIYTSGSTGRPKGVMVEHRNVVNFIAGMDERIGHKPGDEPGVWLAVTSLSFDISVLELFWTLTRGFKVVLHADKADDAAIARSRMQHADRNITFSLMYFASDEGENASSADKYKLLIEGAKFGDRNGFSAVWTPERHFHPFGGLYPNPSVASAALATITENIEIRAASVVMPLHHPVRVAEEWALVDNLSGGRVGISFASGWQPNDFIIYKPERFQTRKDAMLEDLETVRKLWRGEKLKVTSPLGKEIEVTTYPRPVQKELPFWLTAAGNPETFRAAGRVGANLLTHLLGQSIDQLRDKIKVYREAWDEAGHAGRGRVTVMLHTFVGDDEAMVKETVREPMKDYLRSSLHLIKLAAYTFPTFKQKADASGKTPAEIFEEEELSPEDMDVLLDHSFERYYVTSGLFGTPASCMTIVDQLKGVDVDDIGALLDYGVPSATVMAHLDYLNELKELANTSGADAVDYSLAAQMKRHAVTHMQCTPSQLTLILAGDESRAALDQLSTLLVGGEAFPAAIAQDARKATKARIVNMYGPTETTIWSSTQDIAGDETTVPIGKPIANTQIYVLDKQLSPVPLGVAGELWIGGDGVVRGYHGRDDLTAERFRPDPFQGEGARMYRTGDLAKFRPDGVVDFLGRVDFQVKIRGYRIELGEIEAHLAEDEHVREAVVVAREDVAGDKRLVAYMVAASSALDIDALRARLKDQLPPYMVPQNFVTLPKFPLTPNNKVDRKALPAPDTVQATQTADFVAPTGQVEQSIATVWAEVLNVKKVGVDDNFFDLGGHSLLTVQVHRRLKDGGHDLALTDLFRFPTIRALVGFIEQDGNSETMDKSRDRAAARKEAMSRRAKLRNRRRRT